MQFKHPGKKKDSYGLCKLYINVLHFIGLFRLSNLLSVFTISAVKVLFIFGTDPEYDDTNLIQ
jgi:hypothetical protein